jgi:small subunit ribosomal protein S2
MVTKDSKEEEKKTGEESSMVPVEDYLKAGIHIGSKYKTGDMERYIYKTRQDGLHVLDIKTVDDRIKMVADFLSTYEPSSVLVVAERIYARKPTIRFGELTGINVITRRFVPGTLTNPKKTGFIEPSVVIVADPGVDKQVLDEAKKSNIPVIALCDTNNLLKNVDVALPMNNKGKKALALVYWLLAREILRNRGIIKKEEDFKVSVEEFESVGR